MFGCTSLGRGEYGTGVEDVGEGNGCCESG